MSSHQSGLMTASLVAAATAMVHTTTTNNDTPSVSTTSKPVPTKSNQESSEQSSTEGPLKPYPFFYYRDFSREKEPFPASSKSLKGANNFPVKMHIILSDPELEDIVGWLPHGRSWRILRPKEFERKVIPAFFEHSKFSSFIRQANGWGFRRVIQGRDRGSYYHERFLRGMPWLCKKMKRPGKAMKITIDTDHEPDLYKISEMLPLAEPKNGASESQRRESISSVKVVASKPVEFAAEAPVALPTVASACIKPQRVLNSPQSVSVPQVATSQLLSDFANELFVATLKACQQQVAAQIPLPVRGPASVFASAPAPVLSSPSREQQVKQLLLSLLSGQAPLPAPAPALAAPPTNFGSLMGMSTPTAAAFGSNQSATDALRLQRALEDLVKATSPAGPSSPMSGFLRR